MSRYDFLLALGVLLFGMGLLGAAFRRNALAVVMSLELMLNAVVLAFVAGAVRTGTLDGVAMAFFVYVVATCEIALAMALLVLFVRRRGTLDVTAARESRADP